jgi:hypothetical protein
MLNPASRFYNAINRVNEVSSRDLVGLFVYFLTVEQGNASATGSDIKQCFNDCELTPPGRIAAYLSEGLTSNPQLYIKAGQTGYRLQRHYREELSAKLGAETVVAQTSAELRRLELIFPPGAKKDFLLETISCFEAGANRATVVMCWILTIDHLFDHVMNHKLPEFNMALAKNPARTRHISNREDLSEISEGRFIEYMRAANIISNDVRKILEEKLGTRNSCAHPSAISVKRSKVIDFVEDLVTNVIAKFPS